MSREDIILEGIRQFEKSGLKFKMDDISEALHISKKTIYVHFSSKSELLMAMLDYGYGNIHRSKQKVLDSDLPLAEKLHGVMIAMPDRYSLMDFGSVRDLDELYPDVAECLRRHLENDWEPVLRLIEQGIASGELKPFSIPVMRTMFTSAIEAFLSTSVLADNGIEYREGLQQMMDIIMEGVIADAEKN